MNSIHYQALREVAQNYQSTLAWYQAIPDITVISANWKPG